LGSTGSSTVSVVAVFKNSSIKAMSCSAAVVLKRFPHPVASYVTLSMTRSKA